MIYNAILWKYKTEWIEKEIVNRAEKIRQLDFWNV